MLKLGRKPPKDHKNTLSLEKYLLKVPVLPVPPAFASWEDSISTWGMMGNDSVGDCVEAADGHAIMNWTVHTSGLITPTEDQIIAAYSAISGYVVGDESTDNGTSMTDAYDFWQKTGIAGHKIDSWVAIDWTNQAYVKLAIYLFGVFNPGINLPQSAVDQFNAGQEWNVVENDGGIVGGHSIPLFGFGPQGATCITWGKRQPLSWAFLSKYGEEGYSPVSLDWLNAQGVSPSLLNLAALKQDSQEMKAA